jgi:hypothetical protein
LFVTLQIYRKNICMNGIDYISFFLCNSFLYTVSLLIIQKKEYRHSGAKRSWIYANGRRDGIRFRLKRWKSRVEVLFLLSNKFKFFQTFVDLISSLFWPCFTVNTLLKAKWILFILISHIISPSFEWENIYSYVCPLTHCHGMVFFVFINEKKNGLNWIW